MRNARGRNKRKTKYRIGDGESKRLKAIKRAVKDAPTCAEKIAILKQAANGHHRQRLLRDQLRRLRSAWTKAKHKRGESAGECVCCGVPTTHQHHVIPLAYGGNPVAPENRVWICEDCHQGVHPWMESPDERDKQKKLYEETKPFWA